MKQCILALFIYIGPVQILLAAEKANAPIDRHALVNRHNVQSKKFEKLSPLSVGNGKFAFTADLTGLQTFADFYQAGAIPLTTMAQWGWHTIPNTSNYKYEDTFLEVDTYGRKVSYNINRNAVATGYFRSNPHQCNLVRIGFLLKKRDGAEVTLADIAQPSQTLNLWKGILESRFSVEGKEVSVETFCYPQSDMICFKVTSDLICSNQLAFSLKFPYARGGGGDPSDWKNPSRHSTKIVVNHRTDSVLLRQMDDLKYYCTLNYSSECRLSQNAPHAFVLQPSEKSNSVQICILLSESTGDTKTMHYEPARSACLTHWKQFWSTGGAIDLSGSADPRWHELERRIILSQYLTAIQSAQKYPPQETGLTANSWNGKFHLEMHWWHGVHFALWDRLEMLERSLGWYGDCALAVAKSIAQRQGYAGARWPKMVGPNAIDSPSTVGPLLIWQQPHPIYYAELVYRQRPTSETLEQYKDIVFETAAFMASYAHWNESRKCFELGPPLISAREFGAGSYASNKNPTYELAYWSWGLKMANLWRQRLGQARDARWDRIADNMAPLPVVNGVYVEQEMVPVKDGGHPCMLGAYGMLPATKSLDREVMRATLRHVMKNWNWGATWGWDFPMIAMTAARLGEGELAVDALLKKTTKNTYLLNGHNYQFDGLTLYVPGNGGLLTAVAMMAAGWDGCPDRHAPGFPDNGQWTVQWEGLQPML